MTRFCYANAKLSRLMDSGAYLILSLHLSYLNTWFLFSSFMIDDDDRNLMRQVADFA